MELHELDERDLAPGPAVEVMLCMHEREGVLMELCFDGLPIDGRTSRWVVDTLVVFSWQLLEEKRWPERTPAEQFAGGPPSRGAVRHTVHRAEDEQLPALLLTLLDVIITTRQHRTYYGPTGSAGSSPRPQRRFPWSRKGE